MNAVSRSRITVKDRVGIADERFNLLPDFSGENAGTAAGESGLDCPVTWPGGDLSPLAGRTVRLRIHLRQGASPEPRLFAAYLGR